MTGPTTDEVETDNPEPVDKTVAEPADDVIVRGAMSHRQVLEALSGILLGMFVSMLATSLVSSSLPVIINSLNGGQAAFTWVVTATLLTMTVSTPIWGKLADLFNRKLLIQVALSISVLSTAAAGASRNTAELIAARAVQGIGAGGLTALAVVLIADIISPRERGKYMGLTGAVMAVSMVGGPLIGGAVTDSIGWRWNFYGSLPFAIVAIVVLQRTLRLPPIRRRKVKLDVGGALLIATSVSLLLVWVTLANHNFAWLSWQTWVMVSGAVVSGLAALWVESRAAEPLIPLRLFRNRTLVLSVTGSAAVGVSMFGTSVFLSQYMQLARDKTPFQSGLMTIPMVVGVFFASTISGQLVSRTGHYKWIMLTGAGLQVIGLALMGTIDAQTSFVLVSVYMVLLGAGVGMTMQNFVIAVQNTLHIGDIGSGTSTIAFFRTLGGAMGVSVLGAILGSRVKTAMIDGVTALPSGDQAVAGADGCLKSGSVPNLTDLANGCHDAAVSLAPTLQQVDQTFSPDGAVASIIRVVENAFGDSIPELFLIGAPLSLVGLIAVLLLKEVPLHSKTGLEQRAEAAVADD